LYLVIGIHAIKPLPTNNRRWILNAENRGALCDGMIHDLVIMDGIVYRFSQEARGGKGIAYESLRIASFLGIIISAIIMCLVLAIIGRGESLYPGVKVTFGSAQYLESQMPRSVRANMDNAPDPVVQNTGLGDCVAS